MSSSKDRPQKPLTRLKGWDLIRAVEYLRCKLEEAHKHGWNLALCGGVVHNGYSEHDLDILAIPRGVDLPFPDPLLKGILTTFHSYPGFVNPYVSQVFPNPERVVHTFKPFEDLPPIELIVVLPSQSRISRVEPTAAKESCVHEIWDYRGGGDFEYCAQCGIQRQRGGF